MPPAVLGRAEVGGKLPILIVYTLLLLLLYRKRS